MISPLASLSLLHIPVVIQMTRYFSHAYNIGVLLMCCLKQDNDGAGFTAPRLRPVKTEDATIDATSRPVTPDVVVVDSVYSTDDSEQIVERLIAIDSRSPSRASLHPARTTPRSPSPGNAPFTRSLPRNPDSPPGLEWKRTVLIPTKHISSQSDQYVVKDVGAHQTDMSTRHAGMRAASSSSSLPHVSLRIAAPVFAPIAQRTLPSSSHSPSPLLTPTLAAPVRLVHAGWESGSDTDSP